MSGGFRTKGDKNHVEIVLEEWGMTGLKSVVSPGCVNEKEEIAEG